MTRAPIFLIVLVTVYAATFAYADGLRFEPVKDEVHFNESARIFAAPFGADELRGYPEVVTPLALIVWGTLERATGDGLWAGRCLNLGLSFALVCLIAFGWRASWPRGALAAIGLLAFPYTLPLSVHLYTDVMAAALAGLGTIAVLHRRAVPAFLALSAAIATRQYLVQVAAALAAAEAVAWLRGGVDRWRNALASLMAVGTLGGWIVFFGGLAPKAGLDAWIGNYPAPMLTPTDFILHYGLYSLTGIGAYYVLMEGVLFRELPALGDILRWRSAVAAIGLLALFMLDPPFLTSSHPGGPIGRVSRFLLPAPDFDLVRVAFYYLLALLAVLRFTGKADLAFWIVLAGVVLSMKQQIPWEKYLMPTLSCLWILRASGNLEAYGSGARTEDTSKSFMRQSSPSPGFNT